MVDLTCHAHGIYSSFDPGFGGMYVNNVIIRREK